MAKKKKKLLRGLACLSPQRRREIAAKGGKASQARGTGHRWSSEEAAVAGRKGGKISRRRSKKYTAAEIAERDKDVGR
jgi:general stress protein YciG